VVSIYGCGITLLKTDVPKLFKFIVQLTHTMNITATNMFHSFRIKLDFKMISV